MGTLDLKKLAIVYDMGDEYEQCQKQLTEANTRMEKFMQELNTCIDSLNNLHCALYETSNHVAQVEWDGYVATIQDDMGENADQLLLTIQLGQMPPFFSLLSETSAPLIRAMRTTNAPFPLKWESVTEE